MNKITRYLLLLAALTVAVQSAIADAPDNYYNSAYNKSNEQLMIAMRNIIYSHKQLSYSALWDAFRATDTDAQGYIIDMYSNCQYRPDDHGGNGKNVGDGFNREHSFPKSWFDDGYPMYTDLFHLYPTDIKVNNQRSNYPFGECSGGTRLSYGQWYGKGKLGKSTFSGYSGTVFEPDDEYKGDFARTYFYMVTCYKNELPNWPGSAQLDYTTNRYKAFSTWSINLLVKWARQDPVSEKETKRNDAVYKIQGNRNPYIDNPELFEYIWGNKQGENWPGGGGIDPVPTITAPENGSTIEMGSTTIGTELPCSVTFKGKDLSNGFSLTMSDNTNFYVSANSFSADDVNKGTSFTVTFMALEEGEFENRITLSSSEVSTTFTVKATAIKSGDIPPDPVLGDSIMEDWENCPTGGYWTKEVQGHTWKWDFIDAGIWADNLSRDQQSCRMGKTNASSITMLEDVGLVGAIGLWAASYGNDEDATLRVDFSTNKGLSWTELDSFTVIRGRLQQFIMEIPMEDPVRFRIVQTAGCRVIIDDITLYKMKNEPENPYDVNRDGVVNISDINVVINMILNGTGNNAGDVNGDNTVNIADINAIINYILTH